MAIKEFDLIDGIALGDGDSQVIHKQVKIRSLTAGDLEDCALLAERVLNLNGEVVIAVSPTRMNNEIIKRQILKVGQIDGPLQDIFFRKLSAIDLELIQNEVNKLDVAGRAAVEAALNRGRPVESSE